MVCGDDCSGGGGGDGDDESDPEPDPSSRSRQHVHSSTRRIVCGCGPLNGIFTFTLDESDEGGLASVRGTGQLQSSRRRAWISSRAARATASRGVDDAVPFLLVALVLVAVATSGEEEASL